ncbi:MAG: hypothetical protein HRU33_15710 [Rhodobacteraceae bacterium]|nr:hypothetical protein [Paracoccaceae bacterium]
MPLFSSLEDKKENERRFAFSDLAPVDDAIADDGYYYALKFALNNEKVQNIALSGPYGSGKSSILASYQARTGEDFIIVSLATFGESEVKDTDTGLIEKSILQQLLYSVDAKAVPYSRLSRITPVRWVEGKALFIVVWLSLAYLYRQQDWNALLRNFQKNLGFDWLLLELLSVIFLFGGFVFFVAWALKASAGLAKMKFTLPGFEVESNNEKPESILSENLDEILYFFEATNKRVVVFEDLDRFEQPEIFHKLREINKLLNDSRSGSDKVKFIYAIRDDIFLQSDRTKFFDFIVPVVPIVNSSNSIEKFRQLLAGCSALETIDSQLLRDVCYHLIDLRLIKNIVNEFEIYRDKLPPNALDQTKLLAMMVYKNVYAHDFEALHYSKGKYHALCAKRQELEEISTSVLRERKARIQQMIESSRKETAKNIEELIAPYVLNIVERGQAPGNGTVHSVRLTNENILFSKLGDLENFERLSEAGTFGIMSNHNQFSVQNVKFQEIENSVDPDRNFSQRKRDIENSSTQMRSQFEQEAREIAEKISEVKQEPLRELLRGNLPVLKGVLDRSPEEGDLGDYGLLRTLLLNGYLDEHYSDFISNFHEGRLGLNELEFMRSIRSSLPSDPQLELSNPAEVCADMASQNFSSEYVFNVSLLDHLLAPESQFAKEASLAVGYIADNFGRADAFLEIYYQNGNRVGELIVPLAKHWELISSAVYASSLSLSHIAKFIRFCETDEVIYSMNADGELSKFISDFSGWLEKLLPQNEAHYALYRYLEICVPDLQSIDQHKDLVGYVISNRLYRLTSNNILLVMSKSGSDNVDLEKALHTSNYTTILTHGDETLKKHLDNNIETYVQDVLPSLPNNLEESSDTIVRILNDERLSVEVRKSFVVEQNHTFDSFNGIPGKFWYATLKVGRVRANWSNFADFVDADGFEQEAFTGVLNQPDVLSALQAEKIGDAGLEHELESKLSWNILSNKNLDFAIYQGLSRCLRLRYQGFPSDMSREFYGALLDADKIELTVGSLKAVSDDTELAVKLIHNNQVKFREDIDEFSISDDVKIGLLSGRSELSTKLTVINTVPIENPQSNNSLAKALSSVIRDQDTDLTNIDIALIEPSFQDCESTEEAVVFATRVATSKSKADLMRLVAKMDEPFCDIAEPAKRPKIDNTKANYELANALKQAEAISSYAIDGDIIKINTFRG